MLEHAEAKQVNVQVARPTAKPLLEVRDDGRGIALASTDGEEHFGLRMLEDLARDSGGRLELDSAPGRGTTVRLEIPLE